MLGQQLREMCEVAAMVDITPIQRDYFLPDFYSNLAVGLQCGISMNECAFSEFCVVGDPSVDGTRRYRKIYCYPQLIPAWMIYVVLYRLIFCFLYQ